MVNEQTACSLQDREPDGRFAPGQSGNPAGRRKGSQNRATSLRNMLLGPILPEAVEKLREAVSEGHKWAIEMTISYSLPKPKPVDTDEIAAFEERLNRLEEIARRH